MITRDNANRLPGMEVTVSYEDIIARSFNETYEDDGELANHRKAEKKESRSVHEVIGGSFKLRECRCGYPFCAGDLARRFFSRELRTEDYYLMFPHDYQPFIFMNRLALLNQKFLGDQGCEEEPVDPCSFKVEEEVRAKYITDNYKGNAEETAAVRTKKYFEYIYDIGSQYSPCSDSAISNKNDK